MAAVAPVDPISIPTAIGKREVIDVGTPVLNFQKLEDPQASIHNCAARYGSQAIRSIFEKLEQKDSIAAFEELNLSDNNIGDEGAEWLLKGLTGTTTSGEQVGQNLKVLLMPRTRLGTEGMQAMGELLGASPCVENVILSGNLCDPAGVQGKFATGLAKNTSIKSLCLASCRLMDEGVSSLCAGPLKAHPSIEHLSFTYNRLELAAAKSLANMLASSSVLTYLDLCGNSLGPEGALALIEGIKKNKGKLQRLGVSTNELRLQGVKAFCNLFMGPDGKNIEYLDLRHNNVPYAGMVQLRKEIARPMEGEEGWMLLYGNRQLLLNR